MKQNEDGLVRHEGIQAAPLGTEGAAFSEPPAAGMEDLRVIHALEGFRAALEAGSKPDRAEFLARYPEIAQSLAECLDGLEFVHQAVPHWSEPPAVESAAPAAGIQPEGPLGDFRILREIGRGGMGVVYEAVQISLGRRVAVKVLPFAAAMDAKQLQRFKNEAQAAAHLHHTNIVPVYAVGCERGVHFYAMQYIEGRTVAGLVRELRQLAGLEAADASSSVDAASALASELLSGRWAPVKRDSGREMPTGPYVLSPVSAPAASAETATQPAGALSTHRSTTNTAFFRTVAHLGVQAAEALEHAHAKGIIHRDIKPANLLIDVNGNLWVTDFGLARMLSEAGLTMTGDLVGTLRYMSPEQALAKRVSVDHRTDIYSLGVTLYELLTLRPAYDGQDRQEVLQQIAFEEPRLPSRWNKAIPVELETIVRKAMGKNPAERYATAQELADDLRRFLDDKPIRAKKPTVLDWTRKWVRRHPGVVGTGVAGLIAAVGILAVSTWLLFAENRRTVTALYHSTVRQIQTVRQARSQGYREEVWKLLQQARILETPDKNLTRLRQEAVACMGDFVGFEPRLWPATDFSSDINVMALDENGEQIAIGLDDGTVLLRDLVTGAEIVRFQLPRGIMGLAWAPDGKRLVAVDGNGLTRVGEVNAEGKWVLTRTITPEPVLIGGIPSAVFPFFVPHLLFPTVKAIAITPDGKQLGACVDAPGLPTTIAFWNLTDGTRSARSITGQRLERFVRMAFSPDGKLLAVSYSRTKDGKLVPPENRAASSYGVLLWRLDTGRLEQDLSSGLKVVTQITFSRDSKLLACPSYWGVILYDTSTFQHQQALPGEAMAGVAFTSDSGLLACAGACQGRIQLWNVATNDVVAKLKYVNDPRDGGHFSVGFSRDHHAVVAASRRAVRTWFLAGSGEKLICQGHAKDLNSIAFSPDGKLVAAPGENVGEKATVRLCDAATGQIAKILPGVHDRGVQSLAFSPDGRLLATADWIGILRIWDVQSGEQIAQPTDPRLDKGIFAIGFSPNGEYFAACGCDWGGVTVWRLKVPERNQGAGDRLGMERIVPRPSERARAWSLSFSPDSDLLAWVEGEEYHSKTNVVHLWEIGNSRERSFPRVQLAENLQSIAFHPVSKHLIFVADKGTAEAWDVTTAKKVFAFPVSAAKESDQIPSGPGGIIALSPDGAWLASSHGRFVSIWDMASGQMLLKLPEEENFIMSLAWGPTRDLLAVGSFDGELAIWNLRKIKAQLDEIGLGW